MSDGWRVIDCSASACRLSYRRGRLIIHRENGESVEVPLASTAIVLTGTATQISGSVLQQCAANDVAILSCDWRGIPLAGSFPISSHTRIGARQIAQAQLTRPRAKSAWADIIKAKIYGQAVTIECFSSSKAKRLREIAKTVRSGDPDNREGQAARIYWSALQLEPDFRRLPGYSAGGLNSCLDYAYTILRGYGIRAVCAAGLTGALGVFHRGRSNPFNLVDDLMEPFRPAVDAYVFKNITDYDCTLAETKQTLAAASTSAFSADGSSISTRLTSFAQDFGRYVEGDLKRLTTPRWEGFDHAGRG